MTGELDLIKNISLAAMGGFLIWLLKRFITSTERLRESVEGLSSTMALLRVEIQRDHPKRPEVKEQILEHLDHHVEVFHGEGK